MAALALPTCCGGADLPKVGPYPWHTNIVATTFWVGEIHDASAPDGSQVFSTYDQHWWDSYGGCDGVEKVVGGVTVCATEPRTSANDYFPTAMIPLENPFYLDLPFDDVNDEDAFARRGDVVPWATQPGYAERVDDPAASLMKNRWVALHREGRICYAQIQDAGPAQYNDAEYVFSTQDARPANTLYNGAGLDVSPAVNGCLGFSDLDGDQDRLDWAFVEEADVPEGPWRRIITTSGVG